MSLIDELKKYDDASPFICQGLLLRIFKILGTKYDFSLSKQTRKKMNMILFEEITQFITENLADISIQMLVSEFHFQKDYHFPEETKSDFMVNIKINPLCPAAFKECMTPYKYFTYSAAFSLI